LEEVVKAHHIKYTAQKVQKEVEAKVREKAKKQRLIEERKKKKWMEYLQQLQNKILAENITLLGGTEGS